MNINNYQIIWEKWKDPFGLDENEVEESNDDHNDGIQEEVNVKKIKCNILSTPLGIIPFNETVSCNDTFNFWTGHSNFALTKNISYIIENIPGVETLNIFTKYRFRISVGKAFTDSEVMRKINKNVYAYLDEYNNYVK